MKDITFEDFNLDKNILDAIKKKGFTKPSEIQEKVIPIILENKHDIVGLAQTGTGKTAAFGLPIIHKIEAGNKLPQAIILTPTRELAIQVCKELETYSRNKKLSILTVYGGSPINAQIKTLNRGVDIVVGTPGRVLDLINRRQLMLNNITHFILDEADEMLKMGFIEDIETILEVSSKKKRVYLFSATMPPKIKNLTKKYLKKQVIIEVEKKQEISDLIKQEYYIAKHSEKIQIIKNIIDNNNFFYGIIFCRTKVDVENVKDMLKKNKYEADCIHGDIMQNKRERILNRFRNMTINILVATDVAARGIDINNLTHVINYSLPKESEIYTHRIGRTGRAGNTGTAISLITPKETGHLNDIQRELKIKIDKASSPTKTEIKEMQDNKLSKTIETILENKTNTLYLKQCNKLIEEFGADNALSAILSMLDNKEHKSEKKFSKNESKTRNNKIRNDKTRLFVARGKMDGIHKKNGLINFLEKETRVGNLRGADIKVCEKFSFITLDTKEAELILDEFDKRKGRSIVEIAST